MTLPLSDHLDKVEILDLMIECRAQKPWVDRALRSEVPDRWRLAFAEMLDHATDNVTVPWSESPFGAVEADYDKP